MDATTTAHTEPAPPERGAASEMLAKWLAAACVVLAALTIVLPPMFPSQDAPGHLLAAQVHLHPELFDGLYVAQQAITGQSFVTFTVWLGYLLPLMWAAKIVMLSGLAVQVAGAVRLARAFSSAPSAAVAGASLTFVGWSYVMGFFSFSLAIAFGTLGWSFWLDRRRRWGDLIAAAVLFVAAAWSHSIGAGIILAHIGLTELLAGRWQLRELRRWSAFAPALAWALWSTLAGLLQHYEIGGVEEAVAVWLPFKQRLWTGLLGAFGSYSLLAAPIAGALVVYAIRESFDLVSADREAGARRATARAALVWTAIYASIPFHVFGWYFAGPRVLVGATALLTATAFSRARGPWPAALLALSGALSLAAGLPVAVGEGQRIAASTVAFGDEPVGRTFVVVHRPEALVEIAPWARPNIGTGRYATMHGGADPGAFAFRSPKHSIHFAVPMAELFPNTRRQLASIDGACLDDPACAAGDLLRADQVATSAVAWDSVTLVEASDAFVQRLVLRGFVPQSAAVLRPRPAEVQLELRIPAELSGLPVVFAASWPESVGRFRGGSIAPSSERPTTLTVSFAPMPAGPAVIVACADANGDGECQPGEPALYGPVSVAVDPGSTVALGAIE